MFNFTLSERCFVAGQICRKFTHFPSVKFSGLKMCACKKTDKYEVWVNDIKKLGDWLLIWYWHSVRIGCWHIAWGETWCFERWPGRCWSLTISLCRQVNRWLIGDCWQNGGVDQRVNVHKYFCGKHKVCLKNLNELYIQSMMFNRYFGRGPL